MIITDLAAQHQIFPASQRTPPLFSVPGTIAASLGLGLDDLPQLYGGRTEAHGYMVTKWRTPVVMLNDLQPAVNIATSVAKNWRIGDLPYDEPSFPGSLVSARAIIHACAHSYEFAVEMLERMLDLRPGGYDSLVNERVAVMARFQAALPDTVKAIDHATIEGALCRMIGMQPSKIVMAGVDKRRAVELVNGRTLWRQDEIGDVLLPALENVACKLQEAIPLYLEYDEDHLEAMAALWPALAAFAWQMWPSLRNEIEAASPWFSVYRPPETKTAL